MKERKILIRFDDICPTMDFVQFERALKVLEEHNVKPLLGVIPECKDKELLIESEHEEFWELMKSLQSKGYTLAMHGYTHVYDSKKRGIVNIGYKSEFAGHTYEEQYRRIKEGKEILTLKGIETNIFFAPSHSYDANTLKALAANGFKYISDGMSSKPMIRYGILCIPCRTTGCPKISRKGYYTAVFHAHEWTRPDKEKGYWELVELCKNFKLDIVDFKTYVKRSRGISFVQKYIEKLYVFYIRHVKPILSMVKHKIIMRETEGKRIQKRKYTR